MFVTGLLLKSIDWACACPLSTLECLLLPCTTSLPVDWGYKSGDRFFGHCITSVFSKVISQNSAKANIQVEVFTEGENL